MLGSARELEETTVSQAKRKALHRRAKLMLDTYQLDPGDVEYFSYFFHIINSLQRPPEPFCPKLSFLPKRSLKSKTLVLDLDETLVHAEDDFDLCPSPINKTKFSLRPGLDKFLRTVAQYYELILFTASTPRHADPLLAAIEEHGRLFHAVLYRDSCSYINGYYVKDLRVFENCRELKDIVQVDDSVVAMAFNIDNGVVVKPYLGESDDRELEVLGNYLVKLAVEQDARKINAATFGLSKLQRILAILSSTS